MPKETDFHRELINDLRAQNVMLAKVPDTPASYVMGRENQKFRFSPRKFVDLVGVGNEVVGGSSSNEIFLWGRPLIWEAKLMKTLHAWPIKSLGEDQLKVLRTFEDRACSRVIINYRVKKYTDAQVAKYGLERFVERKRLNMLTSVRPSDILEAIQHGWKSIPVAELAKTFIMRPWGKQWNYTEIITGSTWTPQWPSDSNN